MAVTPPPAVLPHAVIVGAGFGGISAARGLAGVDVRVTVLDRSSHHVFQPLLYQVATGSLAPSDIASPIRKVLAAQSNAQVEMREVTHVDAAARRVSYAGPDGARQSVAYDYLVLATGVQDSYFGHDEFAPFAPGLKSLADALAIRTRLLSALEMAELEPDPARRRDLLTFVLVGAGPTGCEMAGAIAEMMRGRLRSDFRRVDPGAARIVLIEGAPRILGTFAESLSRQARDRLTRVGVEIRTGARVVRVDADGVVVGSERIASRCVLWTAGVTPSPAGKWLPAETDRAGRVRVRPDMSVVDRPEVFVVGDTASLDAHGHPLPGVAGRAPAGSLRGARHREPRARRAGAAAVLVLRQGQHGGDRPRLRDPRVRPHRAGRCRGVARVGGHPSRVLAGGGQSAARLHPVGVDVSHAPAAGAPHRADGVRAAAARVIRAYLGGVAGRPTNEEDHR